MKLVSRFEPRTFLPNITPPTIPVSFQPLSRGLLLGPLLWFRNFIKNKQKTKIKTEKSILVHPQMGVWVLFGIWTSLALKEL